MKFYMHFLPNVRGEYGLLDTYIGHIKNDQIDYIEGPTGKRLSKDLGLCIFANYQEGVLFLSEICCGDLMEVKD